MIQEVKFCDNTDFKKLLAKFGYKILTNCEKDSCIGTALIYKKHYKLRKIIKLTDRAICFDINGYHFVNIYAPSGATAIEERTNFFRHDLTPLLASNLPTILVGDFNAVTRPRDATTKVHKRCEALEDLLKNCQLTDVYIHLHNDIHPVQFTFRHAGNKSESRIDQVHITQNLIGSLSSYKAHMTTSDHKLVEVNFNFDLGQPAEKHVQKETHWKLDSTVLKSDDFMLNFEELWQQLLREKDDFLDSPDWWDNCCKVKMKKFLQEFTVIENRRRTDTLGLCYASLGRAQREDRLEDAQHLTAKIKELLAEEMAKHIPGAGLDNFDLEEEQTSVHTIGAEIRRGKASCLDKLSANGMTVTEPDEIARHVINFYRPLLQGHHRADGPTADTTFQPDEDAVRDLLEDMDGLDDEDKDELIREVTREELRAALASCDRSKSPGSDGLTYEFYLKVEPLIGDQLIAIFNRILERERLPESMRQGTTVLIPKVTGVPQVTQLRPITLLQCDYKLLTKILNDRVFKLSHKLLKSSQGCCNNNRKMLDGVQNLISTTFYCQRTNQAAALVSFDMTKAFDRVSVPYLLQVLRAMNFPEKMVKWVKMLHAFISTRFQLKTLTDFIDIFFSLRQGDPFAQLLYCLYMEPLLRRLAKQLPGLQVGEAKQKDNGYADDVNAAVTSDADLVTIGTSFQLFERASGAILSRTEKSKIMGLGKWKKRTVWPLPWLQTVKQLKILGVEIPQDPARIQAVNWKPAIDSFQHVLTDFGKRDLDTLDRRIQVIHQYALPKIWFIAQVVPPLNQHVDGINARIRSFLWNAGTRFVSTYNVHYDVLTMPRDRGGLGLLNVELKSKALLVRQVGSALARGGDMRLHWSYWLGGRMSDLVPGMEDGPHWRRQRLPRYYEDIEAAVRQVYDGGAAGPAAPPPRHRPLSQGAVQRPGRQAGRCAQRDGQGRRPRLPLARRLVKGGQQAAQGQAARRCLCPGAQHAEEQRESTQVRPDQSARQQLSCRHAQRRGQRAPVLQVHQDQAGLVLHQGQHEDGHQPAGRPAAR